VIRDIDLAAFGRKEIEIAETEMPGLMALRSEFGESKPLKGARITGSLHMTIQTAVLIETLTALGAQVAGPRATSSPPGPCRRRDRRVRRAGLRHQGRDARGILGLCRPHLRLGPGRDLQHHPRRRRRRHHVRALGRARRGRRELLTPTNEEEEVFVATLQRFISERPGYLTKTVQNIKGVSEETTTGVHRLYELAKQGKLPFPAINVNDSVTKSKFDNLYGCKESLVDASAAPPT
jgi:adenosylhomocysteinase